MWLQDAHYLEGERVALDTWIDDGARLDGNALARLVVHDFEDYGAGEPAAVVGLLGALAAELIPAQNIPAQVSILGIILGTFLPVPIAFDVALTWILLSRGVPAPYVAALACTLGAFSVYPFIIVGRSVSWRVALSVFAAVMGAGILAAAITAILPT